MRRVAVVLPPNEGFSPASSGAIGLLAHRLAERSSWETTVVGAPCEAPFPRFAPAAPPRLPLSRAFRYRLAVGRVLARLQPQLIEVHNRPLLALSLARRFSGVPVCLFLHNDPQSMRGAREARSRARLEAALARVVAVSPWVAERWGEGAAVLGNCIELASLPPSPSPRERLAVFAGRMVPEKGPDAFLAAWSRAGPPPGWRAEMFGARRLRPGEREDGFSREIRLRAEAAGVALHGYRPHAEVLAAMARAAIVVVPSRWPEPFGLAALEAMACGAALVCAPVGNLPELCGEAAAFADPHDADAMAAAILSLTGDDARRDAASGAGRERARRCDAAAAAARLDAVREAVFVAVGAS